MINSYCKMEKKPSGKICNIRDRKGQELEQLGYGSTFDCSSRLIAGKSSND